MTARPLVPHGRILAGFILATLVMTWPVARHPIRGVPSELGDPLLNTWILAWDAHELGLAVRRGPGVLRHFWDANIFYPARDTLAFSEHMFSDALMAFPIIAATGQVLLGYNIVFLATFALSGYGMYLLVRRLTGHQVAAIVAGVLYAFTPYRFNQLPHLQVISSHWFPFAFLFLHRFLDERRPRDLALSCLFAVATALACGYYLLYFSLLLALFAIGRVLLSPARRDSRLWLTLAAGGAASAAALLPFLLPYLRARNEYGFTRYLPEMRLYSADVLSYITSPDPMRLWGPHLRVFGKAEADAFPGFVVIGLALMALWLARSTPARPELAWWLRARWLRRLRPVALLFATAVAAGAALAIRAVLSEGFLSWNFGPVWIIYREADRPLAVLLLALATIGLLRRRAGLRALVGRPDVFLYGLCALLAFAFSLGPVVTIGGQRRIGFAPYRYLLEYVPGFQGVRVPARFAMVFTFFLSVLAGYGAAWLIARLAGRRRTVIAALLLAGAGAEGWAAPIPFARIEQLRDYTGASSENARDPIPPLYRWVAEQLPADAVLVELPIGQPDYDLSYMYYSTAHWRRLVNGYSGYFPPRFTRLSVELSPPLTPAGIDELRQIGTTHIVVHRGAWPGGEGDALVAELQQRGARAVGMFGTDMVLEVPR